MADHVSFELMHDILEELKTSLPKGIEYLGHNKLNEIISFKFKADDNVTSINYDEANCTFVPISFEDPNNYKFKVNLKDMIFNKEGYLQVLTDYLIQTMKLESHHHFGYFINGFRFGGSKVWLTYNFDSDPDIEVEVITVERMIEVTDKHQKDTILALKRLFEASLTKSIALIPDTGIYTNYAAPLLSQQITHEVTKRKGEVKDMPMLYYNSHFPNPLFKEQKVIANTIIDFTANILKAVKLKMGIYLE
jgi:hypothetical protein